eukprot:6981296-Pyramimonas_sp.AAC.1
MRALGPCPPGDQGYAGAIRRRRGAMQIAGRQCGCFLSSNTADKVTTEMFQAFVSGADPHWIGGACAGGAPLESTRRYYGALFEKNAGGRPGCIEADGAT